MEKDFRQICKYSLDPSVEQQGVLMPVDSVVLSVQFQGTELSLWAHANPNSLKAKVIVSVWLFCTGDRIDDVLPKSRYAGTIQHSPRGHVVVLHVFVGMEARLALQEIT